MNCRFWAWIEIPPPLGPGSMPSPDARAQSSAPFRRVSSFRLSLVLLSVSHVFGSSRRASAVSAVRMNFCISVGSELNHFEMLPILSPVSSAHCLTETPPIIMLQTACFRSESARPLSCCIACSREPNTCIR